MDLFILASANYFLLCSSATLNVPVDELMLSNWRSTADARVTLDSNFPTISFDELYSARAWHTLASDDQLATDSGSTTSILIVSDNLASDRSTSQLVSVDQCGIRHGTFIASNVGKVWIILLAQTISIDELSISCLDADCIT